MNITTTQINYIRGELESIACTEEIFPGFFPEIPEAEKLAQKQDKAAKLLAWIDSGMQINEAPCDSGQI